MYHVVGYQMKNIEKEIITEVKLAFLIGISIIIFSKLGLDFSWLLSIGIGVPVGLIIALIIYFFKNTQFNDR